MRIEIPKVDIPICARGPWRIERFEISKQDADFENMRASFRPGGRHVQPGTYTRLMRDSTVVMSDTPAEMRDHRYAVGMATGHCLVNGLGIGMVVNAMLLKPEVESVTVVEVDKDVIQMVAPHYEAKFGSRFSVVNSDALAFKPPPGKQYGAVWHDIWDDITADNLPQMATLHRKYGRRAEWQGSWCKDLCRRYA